MKIQVELKDKVVQSYLDHYNEVNGTNFNVNTLTNAQTTHLEQVFARLAESEIEMRTDDHSGFETEMYFNLKGIK